MKDPLEGVYWAHDYGVTALLDMERPQLLDVIRAQMGELETLRRQNVRERNEFLDLLAPRPRLPAWAAWLIGDRA